MQRDYTARLVFPKESQGLLKGRPFIATITGNVLMPTSINDALEMGWTANDYEGINYALRQGNMQCRIFEDRIEYDYVDEMILQWHLKIFFENRRREFLEHQKN